MITASLQQLVSLQQPAVSATQPTCSSILSKTSVLILVHLGCIGAYLSQYFIAKKSIKYFKLTSHAYVFIIIIMADMSYAFMF